MMRTRTVVVILMLSLFFISCPDGWWGFDGGDTFTRHSVMTSLSGNQIRIGQQVNLSLRLEWEGSYALVAGQHCYAFIYSEKTSTLKPFDIGDGSGLNTHVRNDLANYPLDPIIQSVTPASNAANVAALLEVPVAPGKLLETTLVIKTVQVGKTILSGNFICESPSFFGQDVYDRMAMIDGDVRFNVVP